MAGGMAHKCRGSLIRVYAVFSGTFVPVFGLKVVADEYQMKLQNLPVVNGFVPEN